MPPPLPLPRLRIWISDCSMWRAAICSEEAMPITPQPPSAEPWSLGILKPPSGLNALRDEISLSAIIRWFIKLAPVTLTVHQQIRPAAQFADIIQT